MTDPMHKMAEIRKKKYEREAKIRRLREGLAPWAQRIPWRVLGYAPRVLCVVGAISAAAGLSVWAMAFPLAAVLLQATADLPRRRRAFSFRDRIWSATTAVAPLPIGAILVYVAGAVWLADRAIPRMALELIAWALVSLGVWGLTGNVLILVSLMMSPLSPDEARFPRHLNVKLDPDALDALQGILSDQRRQDEAIGQAIVFYAQHLADLGLDDKPVPASGRE